MVVGQNQYIWHGSRSDVIKVWIISDVHWMSRGCDEVLFNKTLKEIENDPYSFWIGLGDYVDLVSYNDKRFDANCLADWVKIEHLGQLGQIARQHMRDKFYPIKDKCLGLLLGNHEAKYMQHNQQEDWHAWLCTELGVQNLGYSCLFKLIFKRSPMVVPKLNQKAGRPGYSRAYTIFCHHGAGASSTRGGKTNRMAKFMTDFDADIFLMGHVHEQVPVPKIRLGMDGAGELVERQQIGLINGSCLRTYQKGERFGYGEMKGYSPVQLGMAALEFTPDKGVIDVRTRIGG